MTVEALNLRWTLDCKKAGEGGDFTGLLLPRRRPEWSSLQDIKECGLT